MEGGKPGDRPPGKGGGPLRTDGDADEGTGGKPPLLSGGRAEGLPPGDGNLPPLGGIGGLAV